MKPNNDYVTRAEFDEFRHELMGRLEPLIESYEAALRVGKWATYLVTMISVLIGIVWGLLKIKQEL